MGNDFEEGGEHQRTAAVILEELAAAVMSVDAADEPGVSALIELFEELAAAQPELADPARAVAERIRDDSFDLRRLASALDSASEEVARMQEGLARPKSAPAPRAAPADEGAFVLPEWGDEKTLSDFLAAQRGGLEEIEGMILGMERGDPDSRAAFKRRLHTLKGEAGVLSLVDLERVCHATEDFLEARGVSAEVTDRLLKVRDWMAGALESYSRMRLPRPKAEEVLSSLLGPGPKDKTAVEPAPVAEPAPVPQAESVAPPAPAVAEAAPASERVSRDAETVGLFGEFLSESAEGLNRVDQILMNVERDGINADTVNSLFRVFHTIKGTAGFLELSEVVALAHETETMLNKCREKALELEGVVIDLVFDSTSALREMLESVRVAVEAGTGFSRREGLEELVRSIQDVTEGRAVAERELPAAEKGERLGDVITHPPISVPAEAVAKAVERQALTGRRLGEELVAIGAAEPAQVAQALRAQNRVREANESGQTVKLKETIKVDLERVDSLVEMIGELVVVEAMVVNAPEIAQTTSVRVRNCLGQLAKVTRDLQDVGMRMRMVPVASVFQKMARMVRDLSRRSGKQVNLVTSGESTEMDRSMVERIADPLVHMIRNACDHGLEPSEERLAAGKPAVGQIKLSAYHESGSVVIELTDDGRGLNKPAILKKAIEKGLITSAEGMSDDEIHGLIFAPGFSTAAKVTEISGRGVGMDVVKRNIDALRGRVVISSVPGAGTRFKLVLPLTLAIIDGMLVACGEERYIIPTLSIVESIKPDAKMLVSFAQKNEMINLRGEILPLLRLDRLFELTGAKSDPSDALVVVVEAMGRRIGLLVDEVVTQQQVVIKTLGEGLGRTRFLSGAAILSDGQVGLILNVDEMAGLIHKSVNYFRDHGAAIAPPPGAVLEEAHA
ncbi:MAG TPA: chemotaxis protein CheA [Anaeromyxobacteraceae bacterium]|nr:chemotaxis protein CheA [Anaeromyxobacteraceae bacterium]